MVFGIGSLIALLRRGAAVVRSGAAQGLERGFHDGGGFQVEGAGDADHAVGWPGQGERATAVGLLFQAPESSFLRSFGGVGGDVEKDAFAEAA
jgi:hypothetical protein